MSVDLGQILDELGVPTDTMVPTGMGAVSLPVEKVRQLALMVGSDPEPTNVAHGQVWGVKSNVGRKLQKIADGWIVPIHGVAIR